MTTDEIIAEIDRRIDHAGACTSDNDEWNSYWHGQVDALASLRNRIAPRRWRVIGDHELAVLG